MYLLKQLKIYLIDWLKILFSIIKDSLKPKSLLILENATLRNQVELLEMKLTKEKIPKPRTTIVYQQLWVIVSFLHPHWKKLKGQVTPKTVIGWQRTAFRRYWWKKSHHPGRPPIPKDILRAIDNILRDNPNISLEKLREMLLNMFISGVPCANTLRKYLDPIADPPPKKPSSQKQIQAWKTFLNNHKDIWAMDFFVVPLLNFKLIYILIIINHQNRKIEHFGITTNPHTEWVKQQIREATPFDNCPKYLIHDNDAVFVSEDFQSFLASSNIKSKKTSYRSPWQNGIAERAIGTLRRELTDHIIPLNEKHLYRLLKEYISYYNHDRCHQGIGSTTPVPSPIYPVTHITKTKLIPTKILGGMYTTYKKIA